MHKKVPNTNMIAESEHGVAVTTQYLVEKISALVLATRSKVAIYLNAETTLLYWSIGDYINSELKQKNQIQYGKQILATLSQELTQNIGKVFSYSALTRMIKVAETFDQKNIATLSQKLSWSHLIKLSSVQNQLKHLFQK